MLKHLYIKNFALIDVLDIDLQTGFSVITGETGAGKSIILGAIGLLLGQRADSKTVKTNCQKCVIEAVFDVSRYDGILAWFDTNELDIDNGECIIRRELMATGKSRGFINDTPVTVQQMRELGERLIDVHSQHQNLLLQKENFQLSMVDTMAANAKQLEAYNSAYEAYHSALKKLESLRQNLKESIGNEEFMRFQLNELIAANLVEGEQETLEHEQETAEHTEEIKTALCEADSIMNGDDGTLSSLRMAANRIDSITSFIPHISNLAERLSSSLIELKDIASEISSEAENTDFNAEHMQQITERLDTIYTLQRKYHVDSVEALIAERNRLQEVIDGIDNSDEALRQQEALVDKLHTAAQELANKLTTSREKAAHTTEKAICTHLATLGMPDVLFSIDIDKGDLTPSGQDKVSFLFSANKGMAMRPVSQVASGGEIARLMLSIKYLISTAVKLPTIIFDEIDTGVSGKIAEKMADIMREMGNAGRQVISITHLPQIAAMGEHHYKVEKHDTTDGTTSAMRLLNTDERITEIAQMLSGSDISEAAITNAKELLNNK